MEPKRQVEIQLGHMCNNRCVFCVSGQQTALGRARPMPVEPILERLEEAHRAGHRKLTLLGGEPTLQPAFMSVVRRAVELGFDEIVIFTNGVKTAREEFVDEIVGTGGRFTFRISIQGATKDAHERTTRKDGSFDRIVRSMQHLRRRGQKITVNMCVVGSNYESVAHFAELIREHGIAQLHLDMIRPLDAGERTEDEFAAMMVRYREMVPALTALDKGVPEDFDLNIGNLPYCVAPELAARIHHDGEETVTVAVDGERELSRPWNKYLVKRRDKSKPESCRACVFDGRCNGVFEKYQALHGLSEFVPVSAEALARLDVERRMLALHLPPRLGFERWPAPPAPFASVECQATGDASFALTLASADPLVLACHPPGGAAASYAELGVDVVRLPANREVARAGLAYLAERLAAVAGPVVHPLGADSLAGALSRPLAQRIARLRKAAPFGELQWRELHVAADGRRAELWLLAPSGERAMLWLEDREGKVTVGYRIGSDAPNAAIVHGLGAAFGGLR